MSEAATLCTTETQTDDIYVAQPPVSDGKDLLDTSKDSESISEYAPLSYGSSSAESAPELAPEQLNDDAPEFNDNKSTFGILVSLDAAAHFLLLS